MITQISGIIAIDTTSNSLYSDLIWSPSNNVWNQINLFANNRFYFTYSNSFIGYKCIFELTHKYPTIGAYNLTISFNTSNQTFQQEVVITESKYKYLIKIYNSKTIND